MDHCSPLAPLAYRLQPIACVHRGPSILFCAEMHRTLEIESLATEYIETLRRFYIYCQTFILSGSLV